MKAKKTLSILCILLLLLTEYRKPCRKLVYTITYKEEVRAPKTLIPEKIYIYIIHSTYLDIQFWTCLLKPQKPQNAQNAIVVYLRRKKRWLVATNGTRFASNAVRNHCNLHYFNSICKKLFDLAHWVKITKKCHLHWHCFALIFHVFLYIFSYVQQNVGFYDLRRTWEDSLL